jgi:hypothetical protein
MRQEVEFYLKAQETDAWIRKEKKRGSTPP